MRIMAVRGARISILAWLLTLLSYASSAQAQFEAHMEDILYTPVGVSGPESAISTYLELCLYVPAFGACVPAANYYVFLTLNYGQPCNCSGTGIEQDGVTELLETQDASGNTIYLARAVFYDGNGLSGGGCISPEVSIPSDWLEVDIYDEDYNFQTTVETLPYQYVEEDYTGPEYSQVYSYSPDVVDDGGRRPWETGYTHPGGCWVTLADAVYITPPVITQNYDACVDFIRTQEANSQGQINLSDVSYVTPFITGTLGCAN